MISDIAACFVLGSEESSEAESSLCRGRGADLGIVMFMVFLFCASDLGMLPLSKTENHYTGSFMAGSFRKIIDFRN